MSKFDHYLQRLRERAGLRLAADAERELRLHFEQAVVEHMANGRSQRDAELEALGELGRPEDVAAAFRRSGSTRLQRFAGGPGGVLTDLWPNWRRLLLATALAALIGAGIGRILPPNYDAYIVLTAATSHYDYGNGLDVQYALRQLAANGDATVDQAQQRGTASGSDALPSAALAKAQMAAQHAQIAFNYSLHQARYGGGGASLQIAGPPRLTTHYPIAPAAAAGGALGLLAGSVLTVRSRYKRNHRHAGA